MRPVLRILTGEPIRSEPRTNTQVRSSCRDKRLFMSSMRPDTARPSGATDRSAAKPRSMMRVMARLAPANLPARTAAALLAMSALVACSQQDTLSLPLPPHPNVPAVDHDNYPTIGTADDTGRKILDPKQRAALEKDIARTGVENGRSIESRLEAESEFNTGTN